MSSYDRNKRQYSGTREERLSLNAASLGDFPTFIECDTGAVFRWTREEWVSADIDFNKEPRSGSVALRYFTPTGAFFGWTSSNANGNYSAAPVDFFYVSTEDIFVQIASICIVAHRIGDYLDYGGIQGGLVNGIKLFIVPAPTMTEIPIFGGHIIKHNYEFDEVYDVIRKSLSLSNNIAGEMLCAKVNFKSEYNAHLLLAAGDKVIVRLNDDFTSLVSHRFTLRGARHKPI